MGWGGGLKAISCSIGIVMLLAGLRVSFIILLFILKSFLLSF